MAVILSINSGSSSVKVSVYTTTPSSPPTQLAEAQITGLTAPPIQLSYSRGSESIEKQHVSNITTNEDACRHIIDHLVQDKGLDQISDRDSITHIAHRVVHGGDYPAAQLITKSSYQHLETLTDLAPLHNASALAIIRACHATLPHAINIAFFDSAFHSSLPPAVRTYAIDPPRATKNKLRKYGFHGLSYSFIVRAVAGFLGKPVAHTNIIALHLGSGASACAIQGGKSVDTSMGLTPLSGLPGATRSGDVDPSLIFHFTHEAGQPSRSGSRDLHLTQAEEILNQKSGWKSLTGTTDFGDISTRAEQGDEMCRLAVEVFVDRIVGYVGSYFVKLGGEIDALVFAGGIGEKAGRVREVIVQRCRCLGFELDEGKNRDPGKGVVQDLTSKGARFRTLICRTDEQFEMARQSAESFATSSEHTGRAYEVVKGVANGISKPKDEETENAHEAVRDEPDGAGESMADDLEKASGSAKGVTNDPTVDTLGGM